MAAMFTVDIAVLVIAVICLRMLVEIKPGKLVSRFIAMRMASTCAIYRTLNTRHEDEKEKQEL